MSCHGNILLRTNGREEKQRQLRRWGRGEAEAESLILWLVVVELSVSGWWLHEAQSLI